MTLENRGFVMPGLPEDTEADTPPLTGTLTIEGHYKQTDEGTLRTVMDIDGHSHLAVTGDALLDGVLEIETELTYAGLSYWQPLEILSASSVQGEFDRIQSDHDEVAFVASYGPQNVTLFPVLLGDMNLDGVVNTGDVAPFSWR